MSEHSPDSYFIGCACRWCRAKRAYNPLNDPAMRSVPFPPGFSVCDLCHTPDVHDRTCPNWTAENDELADVDTRSIHDRNMAVEIDRAFAEMTKEVASGNMTAEEAFGCAMRGAIRRAEMYGAELALDAVQRARPTDPRATRTALLLDARHDPRLVQMFGRLPGGEGGG